MKGHVEDVTSSPSDLTDPQTVGGDDMDVNQQPSSLPASPPPVATEAYPESEEPQTALLTKTTSLSDDTPPKIEPGGIMDAVICEVRQNVTETYYLAYITGELIRTDRKAVLKSIKYAICSKQVSAEKLSFVHRGCSEGYWK